MSLNEMTPQEVADALKENRIVLVDVREPHEFAAERIHGALLHPLSTFEPRALPSDGPRAVVLHCGAGGRSGKAYEAAMAAGVEIGAHMAGGLGAWKAQGLPIVKVDPATGQVVDPGRID